MLQEVTLLCMTISHLVQLNSEYDVLVALPYALRGQTVCGMDNYGEAVCYFWEEPPPSS